MTNQKSRLFSKRAAILAAVTVVLASSAAAFALWQRPSPQPPTTPGDSAINLNPPTEEELQATERHKQRLIEQRQAAPPTQPPDTGTRSSVRPIFGFLRQAENGNIEANGYITEAIEDGGTCTLTLTQGSRAVSQTNQAMPDAQSTVCGLMVIERGRLSPGEWQATITYSSAGHHGVSEVRTIRVN